jgi:AraC-like DNA-binding protein
MVRLATETEFSDQAQMTRKLRRETGEAPRRFRNVLATALGDAHLRPVDFVPRGVRRQAVAPRSPMGASSGLHVLDAILREEHRGD